MGTTESHVLDSQGMDCSIDSSKTLVVIMTTDSMDMNLSQLWEIVKDREAWRAAAHGVAKSRTRGKLCIMHISKLPLGWRPPLLEHMRV